MNNYVGKNLKDLPLKNKRSVCYCDGQGKFIFNQGASKYNLTLYINGRTFTGETEEYLQVSGFINGWFKKSDILENVEINYEVY